MDIKAELARDPDVAYTDTDAVDDGTLVDLFDLGVKVYFQDRPITRMSSTLFDALNPFNPGGSEADHSAVYTALLSFIVKGSHDTRDTDEEIGDWLYETPDHHALGHQTVYIHANAATEYAKQGVPGADGGWTVMFASDY